jgi:hypothetical protein
MELAATPPAAAPAEAGPRNRRYSFVEKIVLAVLLVTVADWVFFFQRSGSTLGVYAALLLTVTLIAHPAILRSRSALGAAAAALLFATALFDDPSVLGAALFWAAATMAALLPRAGFDDGWRWTKRLAVQFVLAVALPFRDWRRLRAARRRRGPIGLTRRLPVLWLPLAGSLLFLALFANANPLIGDAFARIDVLVVVGGFSFSRLAFWTALTMLVWSFLRPTRFRLPPAAAGEVDFSLPGVSSASVTLSLLAFNIIFALQNGLDLAFLWSRAGLPEGITLAEYAHRGAYPLIATALLAALFVLVILRPGSPLAESPVIRRLVYLWIGQNVMLVASTILRTLDYVDAYSLTILRISAMLWMTLVAVGLVLICYRIWARKSGPWLINANLAAALLMLAGCSFVDLGAAAASWNVRHARDVGGRGVALDVCYLQRLGSSALLPLVEIESRPLAPQLRERVSWARNLAMDRLETQQRDWHGWTFRGHRRLGEARRLVAERRLPRVHADRRPCGGFTTEAALTAPAVR